MRVIDIQGPGEHAELILADYPIPSPTARQVLIKVAAAGVNRPDLMQRKGLYPPPPGASPILGLEVSGKIVATGDEVVDLKVGEPVCALLTGGGYAEYCVANASSCLPIPKGLSFIQAAALPETFFTVWSTVFDQAHLQAGETLLIHGGASGIGTTAIQLSKAFGGRVIVTAGSEAKRQRCLELGADLAINYRRENFVEAVLAFSDGKGVNVILDMVGGDYLPRNLKCLTVDGRLIQIGIQGGGKAEINLASILMKRLSIIGSTLRSRDEPFKAKITQQLRNKVWPMLESGAIRPIIDSVFPLTEAAKAHSLMENSGHVGKIILEI